MAIPPLGRSLIWPARAALVAAALCLAAAPAIAEDAPAANQAMSPAPVKGEFDDQCAMASPPARRSRPTAR